MSEFSFDVDNFIRGLDFTENKVRTGAEKGMGKVTSELSRISSEITPFDKGTLKDSYSTEVGWEGSTIVGEVRYSIEEQDGNGNNFNYALWTHEMPKSSSGKGTKNRPGTTGRSGTHYEAGPKYLERPLHGEADEFKKIIAERIRRELR